MIIDIIAILLTLLSIIKGFRKGLVVAVFSFLAFLIGLAAALKLSAVVASYLGEATSISERWLPVLAFGIVFIGVALLVRLGAKALEGAMQLAMLGWLNRIGGILFYGLLYFFIFSIVLFYAQKLELFKTETIQSSSTYKLIQPLGPWMVNGLGKMMPFFRDLFNELEIFFGRLSK